jgi:hypothetical protein
VLRRLGEQTTVPQGVTQEQPVIQDQDVWGWRLPMAFPIWMGALYESSRLIRRSSDANQSFQGEAEC